MKLIKHVKLNGFTELYATSDSQYTLTVKFSKSLKDLKTTIRKADKVYVYPKSKVTRDHMSAYKDDLKVTQIRNRDKADKLVYSEAYVKKLFKRLDYDLRMYFLPREHTLKVYNYIIDNPNSILVTNKSSIYYRRGFNKEDLEAIINLRNAIETFSKPVDSTLAISSNDDYLLNLMWAKDDLSDQGLIELLKEGSHPSRIETIMSVEDYNDLQYIWKNRNRLVLEETAIQKLTKSNPITLDTLESIERMLKGSDQDRVLALSLMANTDFSKNIDMLVYLWYRYQDSIRYANGFNSAMFKHIKTQLTNLNVYSVGDILKDLKNKNQLTPEGLGLFLDLKAQELNNTYYVTNGLLKFNRDSLILPEEYNEIRSQL